MEQVILNQQQVTFDEADHHFELSAVNDHLLHLLAYADARPLHPTVPGAVEVEKHADETVASGGSGQAFDAPIVINHDQRAFDQVAAPLSLQLGDYRVRYDTVRQRFAVTGSQADFSFGLPTFADEGWTEVFHTPDDAVFFGGGTRNGVVSLADQVIEIANENVWTQGGVTSPVPFFWSTAGFGLLANTFTKGEYDFSNPHHGVRVHHDDPVWDVYLILGETPQTLIHGYHELTGKPTLLPWASFYPTHLNAYNRDYWVAVTKDSAGAVEVTPGQYYKEYQPVNPESFNTGKRPGTITVNGLTLVPNVPGSGHVTFVDPDTNGMPKSAIHESLNGEHDYPFSARAVLDTYREAGMPLGTMFPNDGYGAGYGQTDSFAGDLANLSAFVSWAEGQGVRTGLWTQKRLNPKDPQRPQKGERDFTRELDAGVSAAKTDVAWVGEGYTFGLNATEKIGGLMRARDLRPTTYTVDGWAGSQRSAVVWSGDQAGSHWANLRAHIGTYLSTGLSGNPNVTSDVDGIYAGTDPVVYVRDLEWKAFTSTFLSMDGWGDRPKMLGLQFGEPYAAICRAFARYHVTLIPYLYTLAQQARESGAPIVRPTFWAEQTPYTLGHALDDQFMLGDAFLVAPIMDAYHLQSDGTDQRPSLYLPKGTWYDLWSNKQLAGGSTYADVAAPLAELPVFVKAGSIVVAQRAAQNPGAEQPERMIEYFPGAAGRFSWYEDAGDGLADTKGESATTLIEGTSNAQHITLTIHPRLGHFVGDGASQPLRVFVPLAQAPTRVKVTVDEQNVPSMMSFGQRADDPLAASRKQTGVTVDLGVINRATQTVSVTIEVVN